MGEIDAANQLMALSPVDGRYANQLDALRPIASEFGLMRHRVEVEAGWLAVLGSGVLPDVDPLEDGRITRLQAVAEDFSVDDAARVKELEAVTKHDVNAVVLWLREQLAEDGGFEDYLPFIHFGRTSEDINNLAYAMMFRDVRREVVLPGMQGISDILDSKAQEYANVSMLAHTHGQPATPTTLGKEFRVFQQRLQESIEQLGAVSIRGKLNGATGSWNADLAAYPTIDWPEISRLYVESLGFTPNMVTTQIEPHDWMVRYANELALGNSVMTDLARDVWAYISMGYLSQRVVAGEVGSSTMPHKVNPIDFENAEANFGVANALLGNLAARLPISRLQRDLSDSSLQRSIGEAFGHTVVAHRSLTRGLGKIDANEAAIAADLDKEWAILTEAVQTCLRADGYPEAYERVKDAVRGQEFGREDYIRLVESLPLSDVRRDRLLELTPRTYLGLAAEIADGQIS